jgi:hypothetical protein
MAQQDTSRALQTFAPPAGLRVLRRRALLVGGAAAVVCAVGAWSDPDRFARAYLVSWLFWLGPPIGALGLLMLHHLTGGGWGMVIRRVFEAASRTLPLLLLLFLPIALWLPHLYPWADAERVAHEPLLAHRAAYLNSGFFVGRAVIYFVVWMGLALRLSSLSRQQDAGDGAFFARRMQMLAGPGILGFCLVLTFASVDWLMSLNADWFSSIYGIYFIGAQSLTAIAFAVVVARLLSTRRPMDAVFVPQHFHDYGNLMFAFLMLWAYFSFSQFLIIWSGNLPEEVGWYLERTHGGYGRLSLVLVALNFAVPFLLLLPHSIKRDARRLSLVAGLVLATRWVDVFWHAAPALRITSLHWADLALPVAMGGLWVAYFAHELAQRSLLPVRDPNLQLAEAPAHG